MDRAAPDPLTTIRARIDALDEAMHRHLIERSGVIAELIRIKGTSKPGAAFRPDREADMMRRIVARHAGDLPLATVEHIWREIITTFTAMQAPFKVAVGPAKDALAMRDVVRFYFGFSVPVEQAKTTEIAIETIARSKRKAIAVIAAASKGRWWAKLVGAGAPKVFASLPFIESPGRPADLPAFVVGPPLQLNYAPDIRLFALPATPKLKAAAASFGGAILGRAEDEALVALPVATEISELAEAAGLRARSAREVGAYFQPIRLVAERAA